MNPRVAFAVRGTAFARDGPRCEGPPGRPGLAGAFDAPLLFYQVLGPFRLGGRFTPMDFNEPNAIQWQPAEQRFILHAWPDGHSNDTFRVFFDAAGRCLRIEPTYSPELQVKRHGEVLDPAPPIALVVGGEAQRPRWRVVRRENNGVEVYSLLFGNDLAQPSQAAPPGRTTGR